MKTLLTFFLSIFLSTNVFAHGMNMPGPHGGKIQMPANFHTELVLNGKIFKVYLLDINFKEPMIADSDVAANFEGKKVTCKADKDGFVCPLDLTNKKGKLEIIARRNKSLRVSAWYDL